MARHSRHTRERKLSAATLWVERRQDEDTQLLALENFPRTAWRRVTKVR
jgi:hypothetical protein